MKLLLTFLLLIIIQIGLMAQVIDNNENQNPLFDPVDETLPDIRLFENDEPLNLTLKYDITSFIRHKSKGEYHAWSETS